MGVNKMKKYQQLINNLITAKAELTSAYLSSIIDETDKKDISKMIDKLHEKIDTLYVKQSIEDIQ